MVENGKVVDVIRGQIDAAATGALFFNNSFPEYDDEYVGRVLSDLVRQEILYRLSRGVYLKANKTKFGLVYPTTEEIASAIAERDNAEVLPTGSAALNMLGLSTQVPMNPVFLTSGSARKIKCGNKTITFKHGVPTNFAVKGETMRLLVQAMKAIGDRNMTDDYRERIATNASGIRNLSLSIFLSVSRVSLLVSLRSSPIKTFERKKYFRHCLFFAKVRKSAWET